MTGDFYGIQPGELPAFVELRGTFIKISDVPEATMDHVGELLEAMRAAHRADPLAFEIAVSHLGALIAKANGS